MRVHRLIYVHELEVFKMCYLYTMNCTKLEKKCNTLYSRTVNSIYVDCFIVYLYTKANVNVNKCVYSSNCY